jgi:hypothetical protein
MVRFFWNGVPETRAELLRDVDGRSVQDRSCGRVILTSQVKKDRFLKEDTIFTVSMDDSTHVVSENHFYKSEAYYTVVRNEVNGINTVPSSGHVIEAYVVPICLEKAMLSGMRVCEWEISYQYASAPCVIYGLNYFSTPAEYFVAKDEVSAREAIKHVTNKGKYPFCYQMLPENASIVVVTSVFGKVVETAEMISNVYRLFKIPLFSAVLVESEGVYSLSSMGPVRYAKLTRKEKKLLGDYLQSKWAPFTEGESKDV